LGWRKFVRPRRLPRFEIEILNQRYLVALLVIYQFIDESLGEQNAKPTWPHAERVAIFEMA
jgi:hypothetical protein